MTRKAWLAFALTQVIGIGLALSANLHIHPTPLFLAILLCFPGSLAVAVIPGNPPATLQCVVMIVVNLASWLGVARLVTRQGVIGKSKRLEREHQVPPPPIK